MARLEFIFALGGFAASSAFWVLAAFIVVPTEFGDIAKLQAAITLVVASLTLRTYDLSFFLLRQHGQSQAAAFRQAFSIELTLLVLSSVLVGAGLVVMQSYLQNVTAGINGWTCAALGVVASLPILQGSTQALLRQKNRDFLVATTDLAGGIAFGIATIIVILIPNRTDIIIICWLAGSAVRPIALTVLSLLHLKAPGTDEHASDAAMPRWPIVAKFLALGQLTNVVKNNGPSIELMVLSSFVGSAGVAVFRVARSFLQLSVVLINIVYQRAFRGLAKLGADDDRKPLMKKINQNSLLAWLASLPLVAVCSAAFVYLNPHPGYDELWTALPLLALATLPTALQQGQFADLAISGRYVVINLCYMSGLVVLACLSIATGSDLSIQLFAFWLFLANLTRLTVMALLLRYHRPRA
ncbi:hypothetical protein [Rhizobium sp. AG855]|uniref:hypothetical protein n=1 Tax=Rhizobium sp. AG855 TaxID=2183898 RepID=UPI0011C38929|nr:hypothetical protein [Rhizobium sp. AG855]